MVVTEPIVDIEILEPLQERPKGLLPRIWHWFFPKPKLLPLRPIEKRVVKEPIEARVVTEPKVAAATTNAWVGVGGLWLAKLCS